MKRKPPQSDLFGALEEPEDVERADVERADVERALAGLERSMRDYARKILAERKVKQERGDGGGELCNV